MYCKLLLNIKTAINILRDCTLSISKVGPANNPAKKGGTNGEQTTSLTIKLDEGGGRSNGSNNRVKNRTKLL